MTGSGLLAVFAHPDDESLLAGGTLAAAAAAGLDVAVVSVTRGELGPIASPDLASRATLGQVRAAELAAAAAALGLRTAECLPYPDGELASVAEDALAASITDALRRHRPEAVITFGPEGWYWHRDHIAVHHATLAAVAALAGEAIAPRVYQASWPQGHASALVAAMRARGLPAGLWGLHPDCFGMPPAAIRTVLDVRPFLPAKLQALRCHRSQLTGDHLLQALPVDLAADYLGWEYFARPAGGADWLAAVVAAGTARRQGQADGRGARRAVATG